MARPRNWIAVHAHNRRAWRKENKRLEPEIDPEEVELGRRRPERVRFRVFSPEEVRDARIGSASRGGTVTDKSVFGGWVEVEYGVDPEEGDPGPIVVRRLLEGHCDLCGGRGPTCSCR